MKNSVHPHTQVAVARVIHAKPHAIILHGKKGVGLKPVARDIAQQLQSTSLILETEDGKPISIDTIRTLYKKTANKKTHLQIIILDQADDLSHAAQNALLKLLEEPSKNTLFILLAHTIEKILPTVRSRTWQIHVLPITYEQSIALLEDHNITDSALQQQFLYMAQGLPSEIIDLVHHKKKFDQRAAQIRSAREFLSESTYAKLVSIYKIGNDRETAFLFVGDMIRIIQVSLRHTPTPQLVTLLKTFIEVYEKLLEDGNVRIQLLRLAI